MIRLDDAIPMRGDLTVVVRDVKSGEILQRVEIRNKITFLAADVLIELIAQREIDGSPLSNQIFSLRVGTSNTPADRNDVNLGAMVVGKQLSDANKLSGLRGQLNFLATIESTDGNGYTLREAGLFTRGSAVSATPTDVPGNTVGFPRMFARQITPDFPKTSAIALEYSWKIAFTA